MQGGRATEGKQGGYLELDASPGRELAAPARTRSKALSRVPSRHVRITRVMRRQRPQDGRSRKVNAAQN